mmetsp:Transcript_6296/g.14841  ORF Transcript_6296/g.14841 Transcript_6296/m.14841 type:complete len:104 (+) Transcript_6296:1390-1701(+)
MKSRMNRVKFREWWRPVAPIVAHEYLSEFCLKNGTWTNDARESAGSHATPSPYMSMAPRVSTEAARLAPAIVHFDGTARLQTLAAEDDPWMHSLLLAVGNNKG